MNGPTLRIRRVGVSTWRESVAYLHRKIAGERLPCAHPDAPHYLRQKALRLAGRVIEFDADVRGGDGHRIARDILDSGRALAQMNAIIDAQGRRVPPEPGALVFDGPTPRDGVAVDIDNLRLSRIARLTGAPQVPGAGVDQRVRLGDSVHEGQLPYRLHARFDADLGFARRMALQDSGYAIGALGELPREFFGGGDVS